MTTTAFDDQFRTDGEAHVRVAELEAEIARMRSLSSVYTRIEQLEEEIRTVAAHAADLEAKLRRIEARAMNGWACAAVANAECEAIAKIIRGEDEGDDEAELEQVMGAVNVVSDPVKIAELMADTVDDVSEGGDMD